MSINLKDKDWKKKRGGTAAGPNTSFMFGKVPPQALELEEAVLGAILLERDKLTEVLAILPTSDCFYKDAHQKIYAAIRRLNADQKDVDLLTVTEALRDSDDLEIVGGNYYLMMLTQGVVSSAHVEDHARKIQEKYMLREMIRISSETIGAAYENGTDVFDLLDDTESKIFEISTGNVQTAYVGQHQLADNIRERMEQRIKSPDKLLGVNTGYAALNRLTGGWRAGNLTIVAARPSVGKTAFVINLLINAAKAGTGVGMFSLEMPESEITDRITATLSHVYLDNIMRGNLAEWQRDEVLKAADQLARLNIKIDDTPDLNIFELRSKARRMVDKDEVGLIAIDYLQLMGSIEDGKAGNREQEIAKITRGLKSLSKELGIPIIALSQLNRGVESRGNTPARKPQLSDLRESGAIEQDAHIVIFLSRPDYQKVEDQVDPMIVDDATLHIAKNRNGKIDDLAMRFVKDIQTWFDLDEYKKYKEDNVFGDPRNKPVDNPMAGMPSGLPNNPGYHFSQTIPDEFWDDK